MRILFILWTELLEQLTSIYSYRMTVLWLEYFSQFLAWFQNRSSTSKLSSNTEIQFQKFISTKIAASFFFYSFIYYVALLQKSIVLSHQWGSVLGWYTGGRKAWQLTWFGTIPAQPPFVIHQPRTAAVRQWRRQQQCDGAAIGWRRQHLWRKCIHWHCTSVFGSFKHHHDCILPLSLLDGYSYCIFDISNLSTLICSLQFISVKI